MSNAEIFRTHIAICNSLVQTSRMLFSDADTDNEGLSKDGEKGEKSDMKELGTHPEDLVRWGVCLDRVQVGDEVTRVRGLEIPIIARPTAGYRYHLISPAVVSNDGKRKDDPPGVEWYIS